MNLFRLLVITALFLCISFAADAAGAGTDKQSLSTLSDAVSRLNRYLANGGYHGDEEFLELKRQFREMVQANISLFQPVQMARADQTNHFRKITLNKAGAGFDAIRIKNHTGKDFDLLWAFAFPTNSTMRQWNIVPAKGAMRGFRSFDRAEPNYDNSTWPRVGYQSIIQSLNSGPLKAGEEYIIWFTFDGKKAEDFYLTANLADRFLITDQFAREHLLGLERYVEEKPRK